ncbi:hypothetical protein EXIGLDRAFT_655536 [Exidia glandulosa HHB12029]|uniref:Protein kinase domain-containing protein n=1 Tax=Exidia glandulosa HHB12029 TaxID=1314781 RepID=A0A165D8K7_EXIGL|nr:hypothetical protein EXIGLDRAFT_655536 [Exidia glandulosa HHB12029]
MPRKRLTVSDVPGLLEATKASHGPQNNAAELDWIGARYDYLKSKGYKLDERYASDWVPSWASEPVSEYRNMARGKWERKHEDAFADHGARKYVKDAIRMSDGLQVIVKLALAPTGSGSTELEILRYLSTVADDDPRNPAQRVLDAFPVPEDDPVYKTHHNDNIEDGVEGRATWMYVILPLARDWRLPPFVLASEALVFIRQLLEGLYFLHEHNIAHRDIREDNIMMDPSPLFPPSSGTKMHPKNNLALTTPWLFPEPPPTSNPRRYYFIDYGSSVKFPTGGEAARTHVHPVECQLYAPEMATPDMTRVDLTRLYDPFKADVFALGLMLDMYFWKVLPELQILWDAMVEFDPSKRPSAADSLKMFEEISNTFAGSVYLRRAQNVRLIDFGHSWPRWNVVKERLRHRGEYWRVRLSLWLRRGKGSS